MRLPDVFGKRSPFVFVHPDEGGEVTQSLTERIQTTILKINILGQIVMNRYLAGEFDCGEAPG